MNQNIDNQLVGLPIPLPTELKKCGFVLSQVWRGAAAVIYSVTDEKTGDEHGFEVFEIKIQQPKTLPNGVQIPLREKYPSPEDFGKWAKAPSRFDKAVQIYLEMELKQASEFVELPEPPTILAKKAASSFDW